MVLLFTIRSVFARDGTITNCPVWPAQSDGVFRKAFFSISPLLNRSSVSVDGVNSSHIHFGFPAAELQSNAGDAYKCALVVVSYSAGRPLCICFSENCSPMPVQGYGTVSIALWVEGKRNSKGRSQYRPLVCWLFQKRPQRDCRAGYLTYILLSFMLRSRKSIRRRI